MVIPNLTPHAIKILERRYLRKDVQGRVIESPEEMFWRVARNIAEAEHLYHTTPQRKPFLKYSSG